MRLSTEERARVEAWQRDPAAAEAAEWERESERVVSCRLWGGLMLTTDPQLWRLVLEGQPVLARTLDAEALRRAFRGRPLPRPATYITIDVDALDAVDEGGPFVPKARRR